MNFVGSNTGPGLIDFLQEGRVFNEFLAFEQRSWLGSEKADPTLVPRAVLLLPGLMASDLSLYPLATRLRAAGHRVFFAGIWCNADCPRNTMKYLERVLSEASRSAHDKIVVIGHSLGGIYARELARCHPNMVERAILLGAPLKNIWESCSPLVRMLAIGATLVHGTRPGCTAKSHKLCGLEVEGAPPPVPETIIYTKTDGVVQWQSCIESGAQVDAIAVESSHCGLAYNDEVVRIILNRLRGVHRVPVSLAYSSTRPPRRPLHHIKRPLLRLVRSMRSRSVA